ncbi:unnamed protein product, partial [Prorocentrum cordatum]
VPKTRKDFCKRYREAAKLNEMVVAKIESVPARDAIEAGVCMGGIAEKFRVALNEVRRTRYAGEIAAHIRKKAHAAFKAAMKSEPSQQPTAQERKKRMTKLEKRKQLADTKHIIIGGTSAKFSNCEQCETRVPEHRATRSWLREPRAEVVAKEASPSGANPSQDVQAGLQK